MKGLDDYFLQGPKGNENVTSETDNGITNIKSIPKGTATKDISDNAVSDGKENVKTKGKMENGKTVKGKPKNSTKKGSPPVKNVTRKNTLSTKKPNPKDKLESSATDSNTDKLAGSSQVPNFALRIRMKNKEQEDKDHFIDGFSSPEQLEGKSKELKSPQGLMFKYLVSPKNTEVVEKECSTMKSKASRDISDFFSPSKGKGSNNISEPSAEEKQEVDKTKADDFEKQTVDELLAKKAMNKIKGKKSRSAKKPKMNSETSSKKKDTAEVEDSIQTAKTTCKVKPKSAKKSLSLAKNETVSGAVESSPCSEEPTKSNSDLDVAKSMKNAFQAVISKAVLNKIDPPQTVLDMFSKKRKRENDDELEAGKPCKTVKDDSPVRSKKRYSNSNQIESDNEITNSTNAKTSEVLSDTCRVSNIDSVDALSKTEESKRNSLMSYFSKVTKEEAMSKEEKIEMKVQAMVHSPPTTPSKKTKRRSVNSLPGGALSLSKKKTNVKAKLKENINAIDVMDVEESKGLDSKNKDSSRSAKKLSSPSTKSTKHSVKSQTLKTPQKSSSLKTADPSNVKADASKSAKKSLSKGKGKLEKNKPETNIDSGKSSKTCAVDEECLAVPLVGSLEETVPQSPSNSKAPWRMRVCLTPGIPSSQGTLLEEDSDCDEIFLQRQEKKRKLGKKSVKDNDKAFLHEDKSQSPDIIFEKETKSNLKMAPLFTRKADTQARQLFLQSGVPDQVKRVLETQRSYEEQETDLFPKKSHIQQRNNEEWVWNLPCVELPLVTDFVEIPPQIPTKFSLSDITGCCGFMDEFNHIVSASCKGPVMRPIFGLPLDIMKPILRQIKLATTDIKVVNTFKVLRSKLREEEFAKAAALSAMSEVEKPKRKSTNRKSSSSKQAQPMATFRARCWTEKYKPCTASEIIGNGASIQQLKRWLESWRKASEDFSNKPFSKEDVKRKKKRRDAFDDDDDFLASDNSCDVGQNNFPVGVAVLCGPNGSGKTSSVYALAKDLGYKVLEVNASEKRNGKLVLSKLSEATQSHQVQQGPTAEQGFAALFGSNSAKNKKQAVKVLKPPSEVEDDKAKKMSLILFEDVDIVFEEEDEGFLSAISTLVSTSKRPVILTTSDPESPMVNRFFNSASVILPFSCSSNLITVWLQIVSLLEGVYAAPDTVRDLVSLCKGDFRKAILQMQLWVSSGGNNLPMPTMTYAQHGRKSKKSSRNDENDDMSDMEGDSNNQECSPSIPANPDCIAPMLGKNDVYENNKEDALNVRLPFPLDLGLFWWNIPPMLSLKQLKHAELPVVKDDIPTPAMGLKRMLDDSFLSSFCTEYGNTTDSGVNDDSDTTCSQTTSIADTGDLQDTESVPCNPSQSSVGLIPYTSACSQEEMLALYYPLAALSFIDIIGHTSHPTISSNKEPITRFCKPMLKDSLSLTKSEVDGPNSVLNSTAQEISHWLAEQSLNQARSCLCTDKASTSPYNYCLPDEDEYRWRQAHAETERVTLQATPLTVSLDRRAIFTDYLPILRTFCRLERNRSCINTKRRNRFFHYLKSLGAHPNDTQLEILCRSMCDC